MTLIDDDNQTQRIAKETIERLREMVVNGPTTEKINKRLSEAEERILKQIAPILEMVEEQDGVLDRLRRKLGLKKK